ncbi:MAG: SseB family protein [Propionibacteriaceae bacterium]|nr:SseB family protein [Propionibacteriaceae bacterium]
MRRLGSPNQAFAGDRGDADPQVRATLAAVADDPASYARAVAALCGARLLLPIAPDPDGDLSAVQVKAAGGGTGLLAFTGVDALSAWNPAARPVPCTLDEVAATALETTARAIVIDLAGPSRLVLEADLFAELAQGRRLVELADGGFAWLYRACDAEPGGPERATTA